MNCLRKHVSASVIIFDNLVGKEHILYGFKLNPPNGYAPGWEWPTGKHDKGETIERTAVRETQEETGLVVCIEFLTYVETPGYMCMVFGGIPIGGMLELREPDKHREWRWFQYDEFPNPLLPYTRNALLKLGELDYVQ